MSKAFTRESDDAVDLPLPRRLVSALPPGAKNYLTPTGAQKLHDAFEQLTLEKRQLVSNTSADPDAKSQIPILDQRLSQLQEIMESAVVVPAPAAPDGQVKFGATVTVRNRRGEESRYRIVGVDETDIDQGSVSWLSPIAKALLNARVGQRVRFKFPSGEDELDIMRVDYE